MIDAAAPRMDSTLALRTPAASERENLVLAIAIGVVIAYAGSLFLAWHRFWIVDGTGHPIVADFAAFWAAGHLALNGAAVAAYDAHRQHAAEAALIGHNVRETLGWSYPPLFLFVAAGLASLPYVGAFLLWCVTTVTLQASVVAAIAKRRIAFVVACAAPWTLTGLMPGQNGFLTAALIGLALLHLEKRPAFAGLVLGLLSYKPQFGILVPLALAAGGYWRAFGWAAFATLAWSGLAGLVFGLDTFPAFLHALTGATQNHLSQAGIGWNKLQSAYGLTRAMGCSGGIAAIAQAITSVLAAIAIVTCWRGQAPFALKAALLAALIPLATPYVFVYDLPVLAIAVAFLFRHRGFDRVELALLAATAPCMFAFFWLPYPSALFASLAVAAIVLRRLYPGFVADKTMRFSTKTFPRKPSTATRAETLTAAVAFGLAVAYATVLTLGYMHRLWILDAAGHPVVNDFVVFWAVGRLALNGAVLSAYDVHREHAAELATIGHGFHQLLGWSYPPLFLLVVTPFAALPYVPAFLAWGVATLALHATAIAAIVRRRLAFLVACAVPWVLVELILGQNGFLTSAVIGLALLHLEKRPLLSGLLLGFLSFKPQFGVLFPLALAAGGYWRAFGWAALGALLWNGLAAAVFGIGAYGAFLHALSVAADNHLVHSDLGWSKLQSLYGVLRVLGASAVAAWSLQALASAAIALAVMWCWRGRNTPFAQKAALLAASIPLVTPYILYYDVPILGVALAFLFRDRGFDRTERVMLIVATPLLFAPLSPFHTFPGAFLVAIAVLAIAARRCRSARTFAPDTPRIRNAIASSA